MANPRILACGHPPEAGFRTRNQNKQQQQQQAKVERLQI
jgi:hypothetical protein